MVARLNGVQEAGGSNPLTQTNVAARHILKESRTKYRLSFISFYFIKFYFRLIVFKELSIKYRLKRGPRKTARFLGLFSCLRLLFPKNLTSQKLIQIFVSPNFCKAYSERKSDKIPTFFYFIKFYFRLIVFKELSIKYRLKRGPRKTARFLGLFSCLRLLFPKNLTSQKLIQIFVSPNFCKAYSERKSDKVPTFFILPFATSFRKIIIYKFGEIFLQFYVITLWKKELLRGRFLC